MTHFLDEEPKSWNFFAEELIEDYIEIRGTRSVQHEPTGIKHIQSMHACELFCDEFPMRLLVADNEMETHEDLRRKHPSKNPRVSGEIITIGNFACKFAIMDCVLLSDGQRRLPTNNQLQQVIPWLISQNIVPLDAKLRIIPYKDSP